MPTQTPFQILAADGIRELANAFYDIMDELPQAETIRAMHAKNTDLIKEQLYQYLSGWMGGPPLYAEKKGTVCLDKPHKPYAIGPDERDQWVLCFEKALERTHASEELKEMLKDPIFQIAEAVRNRETSEPETADPNKIPFVDIS